MIYLGIDSGLDGAIAAIDADGNLIEVVDTPSLEIVSGKKRRRKYNTSEMAKIVQRLTPEMFRCAIEEVHAMPGQGVSSMFSMGRGIGSWEGILAAVCVYTDRGNIQPVTPQKWKKAMLDGMDKASKDASRFRAQMIFPKADLRLKKHDGRAEALLIAEWLRRQHVR